MTKTRLLKLDQVVIVYPDHLAIVTVNFGGQYVFDGKSYTPEEWEAWKAANTRSEADFIEVHYDKKPSNIIASMIPMRTKSDPKKPRKTDRKQADLGL